MTMCKGDNCSSVNIHVLEVNVASGNVNVYVLEFVLGGGGAVLRLSMSMCMHWEVNVVSEHVDVYVIRWSIFPLFISMCMCMC